MKVIPAIDLIEGRVVRLLEGRFEEKTVYDEDPVALAQDYHASGFSELHIVDLDGARYGHQENEDVITRIVSTSTLNVQIGGGIREVSQLERWFDAGVTRVVIGSLAVIKPERVKEWLQKFGPDKIVLALDVTLDGDSVPLVATHGWTRTGDITLWQCLDLYALAGLRHVLCTDISRDGAMTGPNIEIYDRLVDQYPQIQLQASGGVRSIGDLKALRAVGVPAAISGRALLDGKISIEEIASFLPAE
tara:strand:- start:68 stop:808 length:741 start_codon:yes stop_codon:yes gene_type:complete